MVQFKSLTQSEIQAEIGQRLRRRRLTRDQSQEELASEAGVSERTLRTLEQGGDVQFSTWLRVLRALGALETLQELLPETLPSPMARLEGERPRKRRASRRRG